MHYLEVEAHSRYSNGGQLDSKDEIIQIKRTTTVKHHLWLRFWNYLLLLFQNSKDTREWNLSKLDKLWHIALEC